MKVLHRHVLLAASFSLPAVVLSFSSATTTRTMKPLSPHNSIYDIASSNRLSRSSSPVSTTTTSMTTAICAIKEATFGMGCFWEPSEELLKVDGVVDTIAGYTGVPTATKAPTYENVCYGREWVEGVRVKYDDEIVSYSQLLDAFYDAQKPKLGSRQYASIIFPHDEEQTNVATSYIQQNGTTQQKDGWLPEWTAIEPKSKFYQAEGYHQRYWQKQRPRFAAIIGLLAVATGVLDDYVPVAFQKSVETGANAAVLAIGIYVIAERFFDSKVIEL